MKIFLIILFLIVSLSVDSYSQGNSSRKTVSVYQSDTRFTLSVERYWSGPGGSEEYFFYVQNNTSFEYKLAINVTLDLACVGTKYFGLGVNSIIYLNPNGRFDPKGDWVHIYSGGVDNGKACRIKDGDSFTLLKSIQFSISSVINVTEQKAIDEQKKKEAETLKLQQLDKDKKVAEAQIISNKAAADKKGANNNQNGSTNSQSSQSNSSQSNSSQNNNYQSGAITNMSDYVGMEGSKESIKVYQQNGNYYIKKQDGSTTATTKLYYDQIQAVSAKNAQIKVNNEQIQKTNDPLANYNSQTNTSDNNNPMVRSNNNYNSNNYTAAAEVIASGLNQWAQQAQANRQAREEARIEEEERAAEREEERAAAAAEIKRAEEERTAVAAEIVANKLRLVNNRKSLIAQFPDGKTPLSYQVKDATEVYYFTYSYETSAIESDAPVIYISNVFSLSKYGDGTWPFKAGLIEKISKTNKGLNLILSGYYLNQNEAEQQKQLLLKGASDYGFYVNSINYINTKTSQSSSDNKDYWGNTTKEGEQKTDTNKEEPKTSNSNVDFWGNPIKTEQQQPTTETPTTKEPVKPKAKLDYWGNPIKE